MGVFLKCRSYLRSTPHTVYCTVHPSSRVFPVFGKSRNMDDMRNSINGTTLYITLFNFSVIYYLKNNTLLCQFIVLPYTFLLVIFEH